METDSTALGMHATEVVAGAWGRCLLLLPSIDSWGPLSPAVSEVLSLDSIEDGGRSVDSIVSVGQLGSAHDLVELLGRLTRHAAPATDLMFCEPTIPAERPSRGAPHDVTATLWSEGWSVIDCHRYAAGSRRHSQDYVWGRARPTLETRAGRDARTEGVS